MSETMSNPADQWMQFYNQTTQPSLFADQVSSDATIVTATASASATGGSSPTAGNRLSPEAGRVTKPVRRRSRASRRTPTTLLNTDTTNFRAMVQQFTGGPTGPHHGAPGFAFAGLGARQGFANPNNSTAVMVPAAIAGYHGQSMYHHQHQHQQSHPYMFAAGAGTGAGHDSFLQRLSSGRPVGNIGLGGTATEGFLMGVGVSNNAQVAAPAPARTSSDLMMATATAAAAAASENRSNNFMF